MLSTDELKKHKIPSSGDKVVLTYCPEYPSLHKGHRARVLGDPQQRGEDWVVPVRYNCMGLHHANVSIGQMTILRSSMKISKATKITGIVLIALTLLVFVCIGNYNSLVGGNNKVDNSWAHVETQYQRRLDLVGNIVASVKGSQFQEQAVFKSIADGRKQYQSAQASGDENGQAQAASKIETNVALIPRLQEAYPELKSNDQVSKLITELQGTENGIAAVRNDYNDTVTDWNNRVARVPGNVFAGMFGFHKRALFKASAAAANAPNVDFSDVKPKQ